MVAIQAEADTIRIEVRGLHKLWAFKSLLLVPRSALREVRRLAPREASGLWKGWRLPGTHLPGVLVAGSYYRHGEWHFWDVRDAERAISIQLDGEHYDRLFVEVEDPEGALEALRAPAASQGSTSS